MSKLTKRISRFVSGLIKPCLAHWKNEISKLKELKVETEVASSIQGLETNEASSNN